MNKTIIRVSTALVLMVTGGAAFAQQMPVFSNDQEKQAWIEQHPEEYRKLTAQSAENTPQISVSNEQQTPVSAVPLAGFPVYVNTGDPQGDALRYKEAKKNWIENNQEAYDAYLASLQGVVKNQRSVADLPGFPVMEHTGDDAADYARYKAAKEKWYAENQALVDAFYAENKKSQPIIEKH